MLLKQYQSSQQFPLEYISNPSRGGSRTAPTLHGDVYEWCQDYWHENYENAPIDGSAWVTGGDPNRRVMRGGSWRTSASACRSAFRIAFDMNKSRGHDMGFRVVCSVSLKYKDVVID